MNRAEKLLILIDIFFKIIYYAKNPFEVLFSYFFKGYGKIILKNNVEVEFNKHDNKLRTVLLMYDRRWKDWDIKIMSNDFLFIKGDQKYFQPHKGALQVNFEEEFAEVLKLFDYKNSVVLDVGAYFGETSVLFNKWGAKKIIAVEPSNYNIQYVKKMFELNNIQGYIFQCAVGERDEVVEWSVSKKSIGELDFGLKAGHEKMEINVNSWDTILSHAIKEGVTIAKVDCEGCEQYLADVSSDQIRMVPNWIIETHSDTINNKILKKFNDCGFQKDLIWSDTNQLKMYKFWV